MRRFNHYIAAALCSSILVPSAYAQDASPSETAEAENVDPNIIIVIATQRASNVQDIPIAVTAVTPVELQRQGIEDIRTLGAVSASFNLQSSQTESQGTSIRLRGVGTTGNNIGLESAVGVFIDGVYQSRPGVALGDLVDIEQLEILRGPQGTLFGRNTTAGALVVRSKRPNLSEFEGFANASYGNFDSIGVQGGVSAPLVQDKLGIRVTGSYRKRDGYLQNIITGEDANNRNRYMLRGQLLWEPTADITLRIIGDYQKTNEECCDSVTVSAGALLTPALRTELFREKIGFNDSVNAQIVASNGVTNDVTQWGGSAELTVDLGAAKLTYIGAYRDFLGKSSQDEFNGAQVYSLSGITDPVLPDLFDRIKTNTQELRLQGTAFNDKLDWLVGAYYSDERIVEEFSLTLGKDFSRVVSQANFGNPGVLSLVSAGGNFFAGGGTDPSRFTPISSDRAFALNRFGQNGKSVSIFTHNIFNISDTFNVTLGARYVDEKKDGSFRQLSTSNNACTAGLALAGAFANNPAAASAALAQFGPVVQGTLSNAAARNGGIFLNCFPFAAPALGVSFLPRQFNETFKDKEFIYTAQASWKPTADTLVYGGFTHGFKSGGFNLDATAAAGGASPQFNSEEIDAFELGLKSTILGGKARANIALFYSKLNDFQVLEFTGTQFQTFNVDDVSSKGIEFELAARWSDYISNNVSVTYTDAKYGGKCDAKFRAAGGINPALELCGTSLTNAPKIAGIFGLTYDGPINSSDWSMLANFNVRYESSRRTSTKGLLSVGGVITEPVPFDVQKSNMKLNARLGFTAPGDKYTIELWGNNLSNEITRSITFNTPLSGAGINSGRSAFTEEPRTYGVTVRSKF
jgi:iron complex outermembrane recepter protein